MKRKIKNSRSRELRGRLYTTALSLFNVLPSASTCSSLKIWWHLYVPRAFYEKYKFIGNWMVAKYVYQAGKSSSDGFSNNFLQTIVFLNISILAGSYEKVDNGTWATESSFQCRWAVGGCCRISREAAPGARWNTARRLAHRYISARTE